MVKAFGANAAHKNENRLRGTTPHGNPMHLSKKVVYNIRKNKDLPDNSPIMAKKLNFTSPTKEQTITTEDSSNISPTKKKARSEKRPPSKSKKAAKETA